VQGITQPEKGTSAGGEQIARTDRLYDGLGYLTQESQQITGALTKSTDYKYDLAANVTALYYPAGDVTIARTLTAANQLNVVSRNGSQLADYDYVGHRVNRLIYETGANDVTFTPTYDGVARATRLASSRSGTDIAGFNYTFDAASNILTKVVDHRDSAPSEDYAIDGLYRLTNAVYSQRTLTHSYVYDDLGNRMTATENATADTYTANDVNECTQIIVNGVTKTPEYDAVGNLTKDNNGYTCHYDYENRLTKIKKDNDSVTAQTRLHNAVNEITEINTTRLHWDVTGNLPKDATGIDCGPRPGQSQLGVKSSRPIAPAGSVTSQAVLSKTHWVNVLQLGPAKRLKTSLHG